MLEKYQGGVPPKGCFHEFFWLFECEMDHGEIIDQEWKNMMSPEMYPIYQKKEKEFKSYSGFLEYCQRRYKREQDIKGN